MTISLKKIIGYTTASLLISMGVVSATQADEAYSKTYNFNFAKSNDGWQGGFADYPVEAESQFKLAWGWQNTPVSSLPYGKGLMLSSYNGPDDIFMYVKRKVDGLVPNTTYQVDFTARMATEAPRDCPGVGGAPGDSVFFKAGATTIEPSANLTSGDNHYRMNIDKSNQGGSGSDAFVLGDIANNISTCHDFIFEIKQFDSAGTPFVMTTNEQGEAWLIFGTDSGFEGTSTIFLEELTAHFEAIDG